MLNKLNNIGIKILISLSIPALMYGDSLKSLIDYASKNNELVISKNLSKLSKAEEVESSKSAYYPTLDIGAFYQRYDKASPIMPGTTYAGYATIALDIYNGGKKSYTLEQKKEEHLASSYEYESTRKNTQLSIVQNFYTIKNLEATLKAYEDSSVAVKAQLERMKKFLEAKLATSDDVDRLQSAYDKNIYSIESIKFEIISLKKALEIKVGKKSYTLEQKKEEHLASSYEYESTRKNTQLSIVQNFYTIKNLEATLKAYEDSSVAVKAQLERMKKFLEAKLATSDDVDRLQSAYDKNIYSIESIKFEIISLKKALEIKVGKKIYTLDSSEFVKTDTTTSDELDNIKALRATKSSIVNVSEVVDSYYYPQIKLEDTYSVYDYADEPTAFPIEQLDNQNKLMVTLNMRVFDFGAISQTKKSIELSAQAIDKQISYQSKEQKMNQELALYRIQTSKLNIKSSQSALKAASSALETITQKYNSGIVDNVVYLDALSSQTDAKALYESSLNNLEIAYALYYFYNAKNLEEFLND